MARARNIKPGFARNEDLAECSFAARLLFALLPTLADREGRLEDRPKRIKAELFPFDSIEAGPLLDELDRWGLIARYVVDGQPLIQILAFVKHQNPHHKEPPSTLPSHPSLRLDADGKWVKPGLTPDARRPESETPPALDDTEAQDESETSPKPAEKRHVPTVLIPDSGFRIPDSLFPESSSLRSELSPGVADAATPAPPAAAPPAEAPPAPRKPPRPPKELPPTAATWDAYAGRYRARYHVDPVRNAKVNGQLAQLVQRLGAEDAPHVAAFYVGHPSQIYVRGMHPVDLLLRDAEALRTQWVTRRTVTATQAQQADRTATNAGAFGALLEEAMAREAAGERS